MKIYMPDELYYYFSRNGIYNKLLEAANKYYSSASLKSDLESMYEFKQSAEYADIEKEMEEDLKANDLDLFNLFRYSDTQSYDATEELLNSVKNIRDRFVLLEKAITYKISSDFEYTTLLALFCSMYEQVSEDIRSSLPKYIHIAYYTFVAINYCQTISTSGGVDIFDEYERWMKSKYDLVNGYITSKDTMDNITLENRCMALQYIIPRLSQEDKLKTLVKVENLVSQDNIDFDNMYKSMGVMSTYEKLYESYFDLTEFDKFFEYVYKLYMYMDNAMANKEQLFDALKFYNRNNVSAFIMSLRRLVKIINYFPVFNMQFENISKEDLDFVSDENLNYYKYDEYYNKLVFDKYKKYVDSWLNMTENRLHDLSEDTETLEKLKRQVIDGISEEQSGQMYPDYDSVEHPENPETLAEMNTIPISTPTPEEPVREDQPVEEEISIPDLPEGFSIDEGDTPIEINNEEETESQPVETDLDREAIAERLGLDVSMFEGMSDEEINALVDQFNEVPVINE